MILDKYIYIIKMEELDEKNIINEDNEIFDYQLFKKAMNYGIEKCVCKILQEVKENDQIKLKTGTGFFCTISSLNLRAFLSNNHVLGQEFLDNEKKLILFSEIDGKEEKKEINLELDRYKYTNKELDYTIIEILKEDNINDYLEIDQYINSSNYNGEFVFSVQFPGGKNLKISCGKNLEKKSSFFFYTLGTDRGSSGSPIILIENAKVIGLHKAGYLGKNNKINIGIPMDLIISNIKLNRAFFLLEKLKALFYELLDLIGEIKLENTSIKDYLNESIVYTKLRVAFVGILSVGKSTILNFILGENILPIDDIQCTNRGVIIQYSNTDDFYLYKVKWINKKRDLNDNFYLEEEKDYICKGVDNIKSYLINQYKTEALPVEEFFFIIKGKLKIFELIKLDKELIKRIEFIDLPGINRHFKIINNIKYIENIIRFSNCLIVINSPKTIDDKEFFYDFKKFSLYKKDLYKRCLFLINKTDELRYKEDTETVKKLFIKNLTEIEMNKNDSDLSISLLSGIFFMKYLKVYNDFEKLKNEPKYFFEKIFIEFKEENYYKGFQEYTLRYLEKIEEIYGLDLEEEEEKANVPEEYKAKLINSLNDIKFEINDKGINEIITKVFCMHQYFKSINSPKNLCSFLNELKTFLMNSFQNQKENLKSNTLNLLKFSDLLFEKKLIIEKLKSHDRLFNYNDVIHILEKSFNNKNDIIEEGEIKIKNLLLDERNNINQRLRNENNDINKTKEKLLNKINEVGEEISNKLSHLFSSILNSSEIYYIFKNLLNINFEKIFNNLHEKENNFLKNLFYSKETQYKTELINIEENIKNKLNKLKENLSLENKALIEAINSNFNRKNEVKKKVLSNIEIKYKKKFDNLKNEIMDLFK